MKKDTAAPKESEAQSTFNFQEYLSACASRWRWFVASVVVICALALLWVLRQQPQYLRMEQVLIKEQDSNTTTDAISNAFSSMGLGTQSANVFNELITFKSPALMTQVVQRLDLTTDYIDKKLPHVVTLYGATLPFRVQFPDMDVTGAGSFLIDIAPNGSARLYKFVKATPGGPEKYDTEVNLRPGFTTANTPLGRLIFTPNPEFKGPVTSGKTRTIAVNHYPLKIAVQRYSGDLKADLTDKDAEVLDLTVRDYNIQRAEDILKTLVEVYNQDWINDKNKMAIATNEFIDERLAVIERELGSVDSDISDYKSRTMIPDLEEAAKQTMRTSADLDNNILETNNMLAMGQFLKEYVGNPANNRSVIPVNTGIGSPQLETQIANYNTQLLMRNNLAASTSDNNPIVQDYDAQLRGQREAIVRGINTHVASLQKTIGNMQSAQGQIKGTLSSAPRQAKYLLSVERQQKVKESLYLYLLQKREENELSQTFTANNTRVITPPYGSDAPVSPKRNFIIGIAFLFAILLPAAVIYIRESVNNKVRSRKDLEKMAVPFAGEIPFAGRQKHFENLRKKFSSKKSGKKLEKIPIRVEAGNRDVINESFRLVRSNIDMMMNRDKTSNVIMVTSFNPGSGKSFVTFNLGASFAIKGKRVMIIDCDLRHGSSSQYVGMPHHGLSNYLVGSTDDWQQLVVPVEGTDGLFVLPIGHRPPNPAELLDNGRIGRLLKEAESEYDYVFLDCPPLDVVVDTQIVEKYVEQTVFVVRAGLLLRSALVEIDEMYKSHRFRHMCLLLNGTDKQNSRYGTYGSSYYTQKF